MGNLINKLFNLEGKTVVLAGGAGQIGFAMARALADAGALVAIADIDSEMAYQKIEALDDLAVKSRLKVY